ncbi:MAG: PepSY domain-containing protein [Pseudomonadota bacterium]
METVNQEIISSSTKRAKQLYRMLWRWHFYAGVFTIPFIIVLAITGGIYLFKPQIEAIQDAPYRQLIITGALATPEQQMAAALTAVPNALFSAYELPREKNDAVNILLRHSGKKIRVYVHPETLVVLNIVDEDKRFLRIVHELHGELLLGKTGAVLVELAACWAIVLVLTGLYLWWPRNARGLAGVIYPRFASKGRAFWRDLHAVTGIWISFFVLFLLISGLPWALVWGSAFKEVRQLTGTMPIVQDWNISGEHQHHHTGNNHDDHTTRAPKILLDTVVEKAQKLQFAYPVLIAPPSANSLYWSVKSNAQNRPQRAEAMLDANTGEVVSQETFAQRHLLDRITGFGVAAHEGQLFGWINQLLGLLTAIGLVLMSVAGFILWRKRAPKGISILGAPPAMPDAKTGWGFVAIILIAAVLLPVIGASLIVIILVEKLMISRWETARVWLGLS